MIMSAFVFILFFLDRWLDLLTQGEEIKQTCFLNPAHCVIATSGQWETSFIIFTVLSYIEYLRVEYALYLSGSFCLWTCHVLIFFSHQKLYSLF